MSFENRADTKRLRFGPRLLQAAQAKRGYNGVHVFIGGTGAVAGSALFKMVDMYEEMFALNPPTSDAEVPVLISTGRSKKDVKDFLNRLYDSQKLRHGPAGRPDKLRGHGRLTFAGVFVIAEPFLVNTLPGLTSDVTETLKWNTDPGVRQNAAWHMVSQFGLNREMPIEEQQEKLIEVARMQRPLSEWLAARLAEEQHYRSFERFTSVTIGIPLPSLLAYSQDLRLLTRELWGEADHSVFGAEVESAFQEAITEDLKGVVGEFAENVFVAHTTAVGGMYDWVRDGDGFHAEARLPFAHKPVDESLVEKQKNAAALTQRYADTGAKVLITAAAIGIDSAAVDQPLKVQHSIQDHLAEVWRNPEQGDVPIVGSWSKVDTRRTLRDKVLRCRPVDATLEPGGIETDFVTNWRDLDKKKQPSKPISPRFALRSGENGFFSVANADALYRTMRVATDSELGFVLAAVALLGDDEINPWFPIDQARGENACYYTETDNARSAFDLLYHASLFESQISGLEPMALQDLGSAKHQAELHLLGLLILIHRLRTLDWDAIDPFPHLQSFSASRFFVDHSRPLTFADIDQWTRDGFAQLDELAEDARTLVAANEPKDLERFTGPAQSWENQFQTRARARDLVLSVVLEAVWNAPSLGSPYVFEKDGTFHFRTGWFVAPIESVLTTRRGMGDALRSGFERHAAQWQQKHPSQNLVRFEFNDYVDLMIAARGFVDVRAGATLVRSLDEPANLNDVVVRCATEQEFEEALGTIKRYRAFTSSGLLAILYRLRSISRATRTASVELGTQQDWVWHIPRDASSHALVVPGIVEALRVSAEGLEKTTGTEWLDGPWGYQPDRPTDRRYIATAKSNARSKHG